MAHRLRFALTDGGFNLLSGEVEADETFIGGKARNIASARNENAASPERAQKTPRRQGSRTVVPNRRKKALQAEVRKHVEAGAALYTDALLS